MKFSLPLVIASIAGVLATKMPDTRLAKFNLSSCAAKTVTHTAGELTGLFRGHDGLEYSRCVYTIEGKAFFDYHCLCSAGDGEGSAILSAALLIGHVWDVCGWDEMFSMLSFLLFPFFSFFFRFFLSFFFFCPATFSRVFT